MEKTILLLIANEMILFLKNDHFTALINNKLCFDA